MASSTLSTYSFAQRALHWGMALLIFFNLLFADGMEAWNRMSSRGETPTPEQISSANVHAYVGIAVLVLAFARLCLRAAVGAPPVPAEEPPLLQLAAKITHAVLYILFFVMPLSGMARYYFDVDIAGAAHGGPLKLLLWILIVAHVAGALAHQFYWKTNVLRRMTIG